MTTAREYFDEKNMRLMYAPDITCGPRARHMQELLVHEHYVDVSLLEIRSTEFDGKGERVALRPLPYADEYPGLAWAVHIVCEAAGVVWDPILSDPMPRAEYGAAMFGDQPIEFVPKN